MMNLLLNFLSLITGRRVPSAEQWSQTTEQLTQLQAKHASLESYVEQLKQQHFEERQQLIERHKKATEQQQERLLGLNKKLETQRSRTEHLEVSADLQAQRHYLENQSLLDQLNWLSGTIAHDFRAPLRAIDANCFFLEDDLNGQVPPEALKTLHEINRNGKRMSVLIDGLLDYLRVGIVPLSPSPTSLREIIESTLETEFSLLQYPIEVIDTNQYLGQGRKYDRDLMRRLFKELLDNAVKFSAGAQPRPKVVIRAITPFQLEISDNGVGFNENHTAQLFQLFHRLHGNDEFPGEGIGLCIAQRIALRHSANLSLRRQNDLTLARLEFDPTPD